MDELLNFLATGITGKKGIKIESQDINGFINYNILAPKDTIGLLIGKAGKTVRAVRNILKVRATLEKKAVGITVSEI